VRYDAGEMRRVLRYLVKLFAALSLLACIALLVQSSRSGRVEESYQRGRTEYTTRGGDLIVLRFSEIPRDMEVPAPTFSSVPLGQANYEWAMIREMWVFDVHVGDAVWTRVESGPVQGGAFKGWMVSVPLRYIAFVFAIPPSVWAIVLLRRVRSWMRPVPGHCAKCGYDLRSHAKGERCPECGTPVPTHSLVTTDS
jgi:hypothetical protein